MLGVAGFPSPQRHSAFGIKALLGLVCLLLFAAPLSAQTFPELTGRVVDAANVIPPDEEARLDGKLAALEQQSHRQVVIATLPDLQGYDISDYGYQLGRHWAIGDKARNDGAILIIAPKERKVRIEVGYGLEPVLTDGLSALIVQQTILPRFKAGDLPGGIAAGTDAIIQQLSLPEDQARALAAAAKAKQTSRQGQIGPALIWLALILVFMVLPAIARSRRGSAYRSSGLGPIVLWSVLDGMSHSRGGGNWGGGGGFSGGGGSFGGGGGSFGGGGASGGW